VKQIWLTQNVEKQASFECNVVTIRFLKVQFHFNWLSALLGVSGESRVVCGHHLRLLTLGPGGYFRSECCIGWEPMTAAHVNLFLACTHQRQAEAWPGRKNRFQVFGVTGKGIKPSLQPLLVRHQSILTPSRYSSIYCTKMNWRSVHPSTCIFCSKLVKGRKNNYFIFKVLFMET